MNKKDPHAGARHLLTALTLVCIAMMLLAAARLIDIAPVRNTASWFIVPLQNGINAAGSVLASREVDRRTASELAEENRRLEEQVKALEAQNLQLTEKEDRLEELEALYALDKQYFEYETVAAQVIAKEPGRWYNTFTINRGMSSGIRVDMNVLCQDGLAGIVTEAGYNWAKVRAIADDSSNISAMLLPTGDTCIISGSLSLLEEGKLALSELKTDYNVVTGTKVVTSQISDKYMPGLLIGYVDSVEQDPNHLTKNGKIIPAVDFEHIRSVLVILHAKADGGEPVEVNESSAESADSSAGSETTDSTVPESVETGTVSEIIESGTVSDSGETGTNPEYAEDAGLLESGDEPGTGGDMTEESEAVPQPEAEGETIAPEDTLETGEY